MGSAHREIQPGAEVKNSESGLIGFIFKLKTSISWLSFVTSDLFV